MDYRKARSYIDEAHRFGGEMGLDVITRFLEYLGNPQDDLRFVHIAGTNGKGKCRRLSGSGAVEAGYRWEDLIPHSMSIGNGFRSTELI